ncbi:MAG: DUF1697 domain-containing protein [Candidatus Dormiibacterota bacterium]
MPTHVGLLRGINLGGRRLAMQDLREIAESLGHTEVATYIQSGNVLFTTTETDAVRLARAFETAIEERLGMRVAVVVRSRAELEDVVSRSPYLAEPNPKLVHAIFLAESPTDDEVAGVAAAQREVAARGSRDEAQIVGRTLYLHTPDGFGRSELAALLSRGGRGRPVGTARNWSTVRKLLELCID